MTVILATSLQRLTDGGMLIKYVAERNVLQGSTPLPTLGEGGGPLLRSVKSL